MSYFDIGVIVIVALCALFGLWKGFFKTLISFFGWTVSFLIAFFLTKPVANALLDIGRIRHFVLGTGGGWSILKWIVEKMPNLESGGIVGVLLKPLIHTCTKAGVPAWEGVPLLLANGMFSVIVCVGLFLAIRLLMLIFTLFANSVTKGKFKGALSRFFGFLLGAVKGSAFVCIIMVILTFALGLNIMAPVQKQLDESVIAKPVYHQVVKFTDKYIAGNADTLNKLLHHLGLESGHTPEDPDPDPDPAYIGTYRGTVAAPGEDGDIVYTLVLKKNGTYELTMEEGTVPETGTYLWDEENRTLTLENYEDPFEINDDGSIVFDDCVLVKI